MIGVPTGARQSTPLCSRTTLRMGWRRGPKVDVSTPFTGVTMPFVTVRLCVASFSDMQEYSAPGCGW